MTDRYIDGWETLDVEVTSTCGLDINEAMYNMALT